MELYPTISASAPTPLSRALDTIKRLKAQLETQRASQPLAVVGVGMRFPGGIASLDAYWSALADGRDLVREMPAERKAPFAAEWDELPHRGGFLDDVTGFDAAFFGISPREARAMDPQHRLLLEVTWEALEDAALPPERLSGGRTGLYIGITGQSDYRDWQPGAPDAYWATGNGHCFAAGRIAYALGFHGPAMAVDTACSSGLVAVHLASQALRRGECDVAVAGGVNLILSPRSTRLIKETRALSPDGLCKTFDARANGYTRGEGCGAIVLKRLDHALRDGDRVHAVIHGSAINQDGRSSGFTAPNVLAQIALIEAALADAGLTPADIGLVEAHGTGTSLGDPIEMEALATALGRKNGGNKLYVGSAKTNFGHLEAAAGLAGLLKAIACCARRQIPRLVHFKTLNPRIDLSGTEIALPTETMDWAPAGAGQFAGISSFGISGTNAHVIVGAASAESIDARASAAPVVTGFELAAKTPEALRELAAAYRERLAELPPDDYAAFAYTASCGRARHGVRVRVAAADKAAAIAALEAIAAGAASNAIVADGNAAQLAELPRRIVELPHYPWQRERHAPELPVAASGTTNELVAPSTIAAVAPVAVSGSGTTNGLVAPSSAVVDAAAASVEVRRQVAAILGYADASAVADDASFYDLGLDSLMAVDLARGLSTVFAVELNVLSILEHPSVGELAEAIVVAVAARPAPAPVATTRAPRVAFLFSCQGGQYFGMGRELYETEPAFRNKIDACDRILRPQLGASLVELMMYGADTEAIHQTRVTQPALVALELALVDLWAARGVTASAVFGHSFGEIAAAIHAGVMSLEAGLTLVAHRARLMQSTAAGAMLAISAPLARVTEWLAGTGLDVAAINGPASVVVSGARGAVDALAARLAAEGVTVRPLKVSHGSHSRMMEPVLGEFHAAIAHLDYAAPRLPIIANLTGALAGAGEYDAGYWCRHLREPVRFCDGMAALRALGVDVVLEIGPNPTLISLIDAAGLMPAGGGVASLRRGASERASMSAAVDVLRAAGVGMAAAPVVEAARPRATCASRPRGVRSYRRPHVRARQPRSGAEHAGYAGEQGAG